MGQKRSDRIELHFLPAYSPQLNPDEYLDQDLKRHTQVVYPRAPRSTEKPSLT
jgi:hypothetical protein